MFAYGQTSERRRLVSAAVIPIWFSPGGVHARPMDLTPRKFPTFLIRRDNAELRDFLPVNVYSRQRTGFCGVQQQQGYSRSSALKKGVDEYLTSLHRELGLVWSQLTPSKKANQP